MLGLSVLRVLQLQRRRRCTNRWRLIRGGGEMLTSDLVQWSVDSGSVIRGECSSAKTLWQRACRSVAVITVRHWQ